MYTIYHIPGVKIGCSEDVDFRVKSQGYSQYIILEEHNDINIASKRERELQKEHGYNMDKIPYSLTVSYCSRAGKIGGKNGKGAKSPGRALKGEKNPKAKLTEEDVLKIIKLTESGNYLQKEIAVMFNVHRSAIARITQGKAWNHLKISYV
jgi:hypothetical protein